LPVIDVRSNKSGKIEGEIDLPDKWSYQDCNAANEHDKELVELVSLDEYSSQENNEKADSDTMKDIRLVEEEQL
jgi:hypothetical protein